MTDGSQGIEVPSEKVDIYKNAAEWTDWTQYIKVSSHTHNVGPVSGKAATCTIYVYARNGCTKKIKVTVK